MASDADGREPRNSPAAERGDGGTSDALGRMLTPRTRNRAIKIVSRSRNFGKDVAPGAGLDHCSASPTRHPDAPVRDL